MISGKSPFKSKTFTGLYEEIINKEIEFPKEFSDDVQDLIKGMTNKNPDLRFDTEQIKSHKWFKDSLPLSYMS